MQKQAKAPVLSRLLEWRAALQDMEDDQEFLKAWTNGLDWLNTPEVATALAGSLQSLAGYGVGNFMPSFIIRAHEMSIGDIGWRLALITGPATSSGPQRTAAGRLPPWAPMPGIKKLAWGASSRATASSCG